MSTKHLINFFPELAHLPPKEQEAILRSAQEQLQKNRHSLRALLDNLFRAGILFGTCLLIIWYVRPFLGISHQAAALGIMVTVIPIYLFVQQRIYLSKLRRELANTIDATRSNAP